ncbi:MAG: chromate resistance protein ChrB domain-containing protein [Anaerolineae bacterium]
MKWITRENAHVDRIACPWLIRRFIDPAAVFIYVPSVQVAIEAERLDATPFDVPGVALGHHDGSCSFEAILSAYHLQDDPALALLGRIVNGADTDNALYQQAEGPGLKAIAEGFRHLGLADDHAVLEAESIVYDALYAYCRHLLG